jgi:hypothetical protein
MNDTTKNFLEIWNNLPPWEPPVVYFRLYYDDQGRPIEYTHEDKPGNYIDVDPETFRNALQHVRVINGQLQKITPRKQVQKLSPASKGTSCDARDICIVVDEHKTHINWKLIQNETD